MRIKSLFVAIAVAALMLTSQASAVDTDGDGLLDLLDVPGFNPSATGRADFSGRSIEDLDGANLLIELHTLWINEDRIASIESGDFDGLTNLQDLELEDNQITSIESGDFDGLSNLRRLELQGNQITSIEAGDFDGLNNLWSLDLDQNQITSLESGDFDGLSNLQRLDLWGNQITSIESGTFKGFSKLEILVLGEEDYTEFNLTGANFERLRTLCLGKFNRLGAQTKAK